MPARVAVFAKLSGCREIAATWVSTRALSSVGILKPFRIRVQTSMFGAGSSAVITSVILSAAGAGAAAAAGMPGTDAKTGRALSLAAGTPAAGAAMEPVA